MLPFSVSFAVIFGLLIVEIAALLLGGSLMTGETNVELDAPELDLDFDGLDVDALEIDSMDFSEFDVMDADPVEAVPAAPATGGAAIFGLGKAPFAVWFICALLGFGVTGYALQSFMLGLLGQMLPAGIAALPALVMAIVFAKKVAAIFARMLPQVTTSAISERHMGRRMGVITQGTAARGKPAEVRIKDRAGNTQYLRAEPLRDDVALAQGTEVLVLRQRGQKGAGLYCLIEIGSNTGS